MKLSRILNICVLLLCSVPVFAADTEAMPSASVIDRLFTVLAGSWDGRAIETPVGPVDYAITFHACDEAVIAGVAELSVSDHYWRFRRSDDQLSLTFLSTFNDNQEPTQLLVSEIDASTIRFHAPELALLTLSVTLAEPNIDIRVYHHLKPHVYIRLVRSDMKMTDVERARYEGKSCKKLQ